MEKEVVDRSCLAIGAAGHCVKYARETSRSNSHGLRSLWKALGEFRREAQVPRQGQFTDHALALSTYTDGRPS
jgi:hypothetical protein